MAKGKKKSGSSGGPHKKHGPKRHLFKEYKPMIHVIAKTGLLSKYSNYESFVLACSARGKRNPSKQEFMEFTLLTREQQTEYFKSLSNK